MTSDDYKLVGLEVARSLREHDLTERQERVALVVLEFSFGVGRGSAWLPRLECFAAVTGMGKGHVSEALAWLTRAGVVLCDRQQGVYTIMADASQWRVVPRWAGQQQQRRAVMVRWLREINMTERAQGVFWPAVVTLAEALAEVQAENSGKIGKRGVPESGTGRGVNNMAEVPESGTPLTRYLFTRAQDQVTGNEQQGGAGGIVPEEGTVANLEADGGMQYPPEWQDWDEVARVRAVALEWEKLLMAQLTELLGEREMKLNGGTWRTWLRRGKADADALGRALGELRYQLANADRGVPIRDRAKWLNAEFHRYLAGQQRREKLKAESGK